MRIEFEIRDLEEADRSHWEELWERYLEFYEHPLDPVVIETTWRRLMDPKEPMFALVAEHAGILAGFVQCVLHRGTWAVNDLCYLEDLYVAEEIRGHGIARALIEGVYRRADRLGWDRVYWLTHETNTTARKLYDKVAKRTGFIQYRR